MCELLTWPWPRSLLKLPMALRLFMCTGCFGLCLALYILTRTTVAGDGLLTLPIALSGWNFKAYGACTCFFGTLALVALYHILNLHTLLLPLPIVLSLSIIGLVMFLTGCALVSLRKLLESEELARTRAEQSERQTMLAYKKTRQLIQLQNQFVQNVNHELRTPLMAAYGYFEYLQLRLEKHDFADSGDVSQMEYIKDALHHCEELCALVNNVLKTMEIGNDSRPLSLRRVPVVPAIRLICNNVDSFRREKHRLSLAVPAHLMVLAQDQCLRHILHNLLSNAFKYSPPDAPVIVRALPYGEEERQICIQVCDMGPGIPLEERPLIFDRFTRLPRDIGTPIRGTGLGLYICKHLVEAMQGTIWVESNEEIGQGSRFCFTLPRAS